MSAVNSMNTTTQILEGPRIEAGVNVKLDTSLEMELNNKSHQHLKLSSCSASSSTSSSEKGCPHDQLVAQDNYDTCVNCGVYVPKSGVKIYKSAKMNYQAFFPSKTIYETLVRRSTPFRTSVNPEYVQIRQSYVEWILELADKLRISNNSSHLAVLLLDTIMFKDSTLTPKLQLYAPVCLLLASKTIELDERIPFIPKLRRYANPSFSIDDYRRAELKILDIVDWNPQYSTAIEITEFLMCQGVLFSTDEVEHHVTHSERAKLSPEALRENTQHENTHHVEVKSEDKKETAKDHEKLASPNSKENNENSYSEASTTGTNNDNLIILPPVAEEEPSPINVVSPFLKHNSTPKTPAETHQSLVKVGVPVEKKLNEILTHFETSYTKLATLLVKDAEFIEYEPKTLAASIIAFLRYINKISPIWNSDFEIITCLKFSQISTCFELIHKKYNTAFNMNTPKLQNVYYSPNSNARDLQSEIKLNKSVSCNEKTNSSQKVESFNKASVVSSIYSRPAAALANISDLQNSDSKQNERKPIFSYQKQNTMPLSNVSTSKYLNGTVNTEVPQRAPVKGQIFTNNLPQKSSFSSNQDFLTAYYSGNTSASSNTAGSISAAGSTSTAFDYISSLVGENLGRGDSFNSKSSLLSNRSNSSMENSAAYQTKIGVLKK